MLALIRPLRSAYGASVTTQVAQDRLRRASGEPMRYGPLDVYEGLYVRCRLYTGPSLARTGRRYCAWVADAGRSATIGRTDITILPSH